MENTVRYETDGKKLTAFFEGKVNAANAAGIENELLEQADGKEEVILDYEKLIYISSAGIRTLVRLKQTVGKVSIINVAPDIYEVLDNTGITNIIKVKRALREVSVDHLEKVGQGGTASVYRLDEDRIIKVFISNFPFFMVDEERELSRKLFLEGVPTAVPYEIVRCGDHLGVIYEMLNANDGSSEEDDEDRDPGFPAAGSKNGSCDPHVGEGGPDHGSGGRKISEDLHQHSGQKHLCPRGLPSGKCHEDRGRTDPDRYGRILEGTSCL